MTNLKNFTFDELEMLHEFLDALLEQDLPDGFSENGMTIKYNEEYDEIFLTNSRKQIIKLTDDYELTMWYTLENSDIEGTFEDLVDAYDDGYIEEPEDLKKLIKIAKTEERIYGCDTSDLIKAIKEDLDNEKDL